MQFCGEEDETFGQTDIKKRLKKRRFPNALSFAKNDLNHLSRIKQKNIDANCEAKAEICAWKCYGSRLCISFIVLYISGF